MVKGVSRQVIVVRSPDRKMFEEAIFLLNERAVGSEGVTDQELLKEAEKAFHCSRKKRHSRLLACGPLWALAGAAFTGCIWLLSAFI